VVLAQEIDQLLAGPLIVHIEERNQVGDDLVEAKLPQGGQRMAWRPDLKAVAHGQIERPVARHTQQVGDLCLCQAQRCYTLRHRFVLSGVAQAQQLVERRRVGLAARGHKRSLHMGAHWPMQIAAVAAPIVIQWFAHHRPHSFEWA
jgi:hypothetical protein